MKLLSNRYLRLRILLIMLIGSVCLVASTGFAVYAIQSSRTDIVTIERDVFPALVTVDKSLQTLPGLRDALREAAQLADGSQLEDAERHLHAIRDALAGVGTHLPAYSADVDATVYLLGRMQAAAREVVLERMQNRSSNEQAQAQQQRVDRLHVEAVERLQQLQLRLQNDYAVILTRSDRNHVQHLRLLLILSVAALALLVSLSLLVATRVARFVYESHALKDDFLARIGHEMRTPMHGIQGVLELLDSQAMNTENRQYLRAARDSASDLMRLINDMLDFSDLQTGDFSHLDRVFNLHQLVHTLVDKYQVLCQQKGLSFYFSDDASSDVDLVGDDQRIAHVISHLLENALRYTEEGSIKLSVHGQSMRGKAQDYSVRFIISDTGPGMDAARIDTTFSRQVHLRQRLLQRDGHYGIGLPVCQQLVEMMGGSLHYNHAPDHGSVMTVLIPLTRAQTHVSAQTESAPDDAAAGHTTVLVAEDNTVSQMVLKGFLQRIGCRVLTAANGREAIDVVAQESVDVILMDCDMPVLDGFEATRLIRQMPAPWNAIPIIAVTANAHDSDRKQCLQAGMNDYLKKPVDFDTIRRRIEHLRRPLALVKG